MYLKSKPDQLELTATMFYDDLVEKCKKGDARSYQTLYQQYSKAMYNTSLRILNNSSDAEDVLQEAFMDAFRFLNDFNYKSTFGAWLKRIVINKSINILRKHKADLVDIDTTSVHEVANDDVLDEENIQFRVEEVKRCVKLLPNGYRTVLTLYLVEGYDHEEIAEIMRISESTVRTQYHRAKHKLLHIIQQGGAK
ncbi:MAG TPA: RNA polymerase sigma factor [Chitinophagaceae bacterium]|nr:RNA polymerase sigma factor [Chitinophagaceae bacterium]